MKNIYLLLTLYFCVATINVGYSQASRTWVSGVGDDANPCSRTAPCKTFAGAISKTAAKGEISVLDPGGYGAVTITKGMTINGDGTLAGILSAGTNGIVINTSDSVIIRNISIIGFGTGLSGIQVSTASTGYVHVENCTIAGFTIAGIQVASTSRNILSVKNTTINADSTGIKFTSSSANIRAIIDNTTIAKTIIGINNQASGSILLKNTVLDLNGKAIQARNNAVVNVENCSISSNETGVSAEGNSIVRLSNCSIFNNSTAGVASSGSGQLISFGNNRVAGNTTNSPLRVIATQ